MLKQAMAWMVVLMVWGTALKAEAAEGLIGLDTRWEGPQVVTFRPANGATADVNPPRLSWPYVAHVQTPPAHLLQGEHGERTVPFREFTLQICSAGDFADPEIEVNTGYNFYNALPSLEAGEWSWRVRYAEVTDEEAEPQWGAVRTFVIEEETTEWDRTIIHEAASEIAQSPRPLLGPEDGDWDAWREELKSGEPSGALLEYTINRANTATRQEWWDDFPETDKEGEQPYSDADWGQEIGARLVDAAIAHRLTGDEEFAKAKDHFLHIAAFEPGGFTSPEYHYTGAKWGTRVTVHLAMFYDWWHDLLSEDERQKLLDAIEWRLELNLLEHRSWQGGKGIWPASVAIRGTSHPMENFLWATQAMLLTAGDLDLSSQKLPLGLHYLTGVTAHHGPDEGWNEGLGYGVWKSIYTLEASLLADLVLPDLNIGRNPMLHRLGRWHAHLFPFGVERLPFGDESARNISRFESSQMFIMRRLAWLTGNPLDVYRYDVLTERHTDHGGGRAWVDLAASATLQSPSAAQEEPTRAHFPEAGWVMVSSHGPSDADGFEDSIGMIFQSRPRGGWGHSFRAENTFAWYAHGATLSAPGGSARFRDPHARHTMSHNGILINGEGQEWEPGLYEARYPFAGRLLAYEEHENYVHWVGDATYAYQTVEGLLRAHRHVIFVDDEWFAVFDDLAMRPNADPAAFSHLFHVAQDVPGELDAEAAEFVFEMDGVQARMALANDPDSLEMVNLQHRDGFKNPVTGEDMYEEAVETQAQFDREPFGMAHNIWATNREPARDWHFLSTYTAAPMDEEPIEMAFPSSRQAVATYPDGRERSVSFDPNVSAGIEIDLERYRAHALEGDPNYLPPEGETQSLSMDDSEYTVEWLYDEPFNSSWPLRWIQEGDSVLRAKDGHLHQTRPHQDMAIQSTVWFRPELPENFVMRVRAQVAEPSEDNAGNINLIFHGREPDGERIQFGRSGSYDEYHEFPNYIITLVGGDTDDGHNRLRRNPGFDLLVDNQDVRSHAGETYELLVTMLDGRIRYYIDGQQTIDYTDDEPHPAGRFGLRTWNSNIVWKDIEIGRLHAD